MNLEALQRKFAGSWPDRFPHRVHKAPMPSSALTAAGQGACVLVDKALAWSQRVAPI